MGESTLQWLKNVVTNIVFRNYATFNFHQPILKEFFINFILNKVDQLGENTIKRAKGAKVKVLFQGLHMTCVIFVLIYNFLNYILSTPF